MDATTIQPAGQAPPPQGRRSVNTDKVHEIAQSVAVIGLLHPVGLSDDYRLICGLHRIRACEKLGWKTIPALVLNGLGALRMEQAELDENLRRCNLTALEEAEAIERAKTIYEKLHPEAASGMSQAAGMNRSKGHHVVAKMATTFAEDTAKRTGKSARSIRRYVGLASSIEPEVRKMLKGHPIENCRKDLQQLGRMTDLERRQIGRVIHEKKAGTLRDAVLHALTEISGGLSVLGKFSRGMLEVVVPKSVLNILPEMLMRNGPELHKLAMQEDWRQRAIACTIHDGKVDSVNDALVVLADSARQPLVRAGTFRPDTLPTAEAGDDEHHTDRGDRPGDAHAVAGIRHCQKLAMEARTHLSDNSRGIPAAQEILDELIDQLNQIAEDLSPCEEPGE